MACLGHANSSDCRRIQFPVEGMYKCRDPIGFALLGYERIGVDSPNSNQFMAEEAL